MHADVLLYDTWEAGRHDPEMVASLRQFHPGKPIVLTSSRAALEDHQGRRGEPHLSWSDQGRRRSGDSARRGSRGTGSAEALNGHRGAEP